MRSPVALAALALSGTANLAAAGACRPRNSASTLASTVIPTSTATGSEPTQTGALPKVRNLASNGNMAEIDPEDPTTFPDWDVEGDAKIVGGQGRQEAGSNERGAAAMSASNTGSGKRDMGISVSISQTIASLDLTTPYTIRFYYLVVTSPQAINLCELTAYLGGTVFHQSWVFSQGTAISWNEVLKSVQPAQVNAPLSIGMNCLLGGGATILVDSVFISNLVTPQTINDFAVDFGNSGTGENPPLTPPAVGPTSAVPGESTSFPASGEQETSTWFTSGEEETPTPTWFTTGPGEEETSVFTSGSAEQQTSWFTSGFEEGSTWATSAPEETSTWYSSGAEEHSTWYTSGAEEHSTWYTSGSGEQEASTWYTSGAEEHSTRYTSGVEEPSTWYTTTPEQQQTSEPESQFTTAWTEPGTQSSSTLPDTTSSAPPTFCSKALNGGCWWKRPWSGEDMVNCASRGSWPGPDGQGWEVTERPDNWPQPWSQLWCLGWCSLTPGCKSVAYMPDTRTCRFSKFEVQDASFVHGPNPNVDTPGVFYWHDLSCFNCPCNEEDEVTSVPEIPSTAVTAEPESTQAEPETTTQPEPETTSQAEPTSEPTTGAFTLPPASTCPKALKDGCKWTNQEIGHAFCAYRGTWPADDAAGWAVSPPEDYPIAWTQMWCVAWCSLDPRCKSAAWMDDRSCRFSTHEVQDADFIMAADPNQDNPEEGIYYWHDLSCMTCACHDDPTTTTFVTTTTQASLPGGGEEETWIWLTPTPEPPVEEQACEWDWGQGICYRPFEKEQGPCGGSLKIVNPAQYTKLPYDWVPQVSEPVHCAILCHTNPDCGAWGFEWSMNMNCVLSLNKRSVDDLEVVSSGAEWRWYDRDCWVCKDCVTSWDWTWGSQPSTALPSETYTTTYPTTTEEPVYTTTTAQPAETTCPTLDEPIKLCQRTGHTGNCEGKVDWVNPTNYYKASMDRFPEQEDAVDALTCAAICKANPDCRAFGWYPEIECVIAVDQKTMDDLEWGVRSPQWYLWFNLDCFECDETCVDGQYRWTLEAAEETHPAVNPTVFRV
ncbi:hypothetical protein CDV31_005177 [Fusarium ambrosium]|uniref:Apple domain-containing protein n=1 Tax=Fusarium ambrosium TaxID=131363 RepID=A0A428ULE0_9HYPO|nr:hypothetical protein CDV31_005177 [Fusarium ambrosium]